MNAICKHSGWASSETVASPNPKPAGEFSLVMVNLSWRERPGPRAHSLIDSATVPFPLHNPLFLNSTSRSSYDTLTFCHNDNTKTGVRPSWHREQKALQTAELAAMIASDKQWSEKNRALNHHLTVNDNILPYSIRISVTSETCGYMRRVRGGDLITAAVTIYYIWSMHDALKSCLMFF